MAKLGLVRLEFSDFDILFDEKGNVFGLKGKFVGNHEQELTDYFAELDRVEQHGATCTNGHLMKLITVPIAKDRDLLNCDICKGHIHIEKGYMNCGLIACDYDICHPCGDKILHRATGK